jgi:hypothetical protein
MDRRPWHPRRHLDPADDYLAASPAIGDKRLRRR